MKTILLFILSVFSLYVSATPPQPPVGKRWSVKENLCDEFNGTELDKSKWYDYKPNWRGRPPGLFVPEMVSVGGGYMKIRAEKMKEPVYIKNWRGETNVFTIAGGAVSSLKEDAYFGYYECRFKAAKTTMSTTFWLSTRQRYDGPEGKGKYGLELDIQECIGREGDFKGSYFATGMNSNTHFWYTDEKGEKHDYRSEKVSFENEKLASDEFNIYGGWWRDESTVSFYYNNGEPKTVHFYDKVKKKPFDQPMGLNMVSETYPFPWIEVPNDEELADPDKSVCYYDWVRVYTLVDVGAPSTITKPSVMFNEEVSFRKKFCTLMRGEKLAFTIDYMANDDREIALELFDKDKNLIVRKTYPAIAGYGCRVLKDLPAAKLKKNGAYTAWLYIRPKGARDNSAAYDSDELTFTVE